MSEALTWLTNKINLTAPLEYGGFLRSDPEVEIKHSKLLRIKHEFEHIEKENEELKDKLEQSNRDLRKRNESLIRSLHNKGENIKRLKNDKANLENEIRRLCRELNFKKEQSEWVKY